ncbi:MAG: hypothetical protein EAZ89_12535 [Bacteroidetes bacterium]|nr:MAG: hypothetical protein EAZ89_12535 [Bacteroidota bacterium]
MKKIFALLLLTASLSACRPPQTSGNAREESPSLPPVVQADTLKPQTVAPAPSALEVRLQGAGLVNIRAEDPEIEVRMMYSTPDNFLGKDVYGDFDQCYLQAEVAARLAKADSFLKEKHPRLRLVVFDCVRPRSVQYQMWEIVKGTEQQQYVAAPGGQGSMHNYGCAVDLGLVSLDTGLVDMGTPFDFFGELAHPQHEKRFLASGELTAAQVSHREILRASMRSAGFAGIPHEWWHFIAFNPEEVRARYKIVE